MFVHTPSSKESPISYMFMPNSEGNIDDNPLGLISINDFLTMNSQEENSYTGGLQSIGSLLCIPQISLGGITILPRLEYTNKR